MRGNTPPPLFSPQTYASCLEEVNTILVPNLKRVVAVVSH